MMNKKEKKRLVLLIAATSVLVGIVVLKALILGGVI
jgi:hypothetical protein